MDSQTLNIHPEKPTDTDTDTDTMEPCCHARHGPFATIDVTDGYTALGHLNLWISDGVPHAVDYKKFDAPDEHLPALEMLGNDPFT